MHTRLENGANGFLIGLITGGIIGAGLAIAFAPPVSELRKRVAKSAEDLSDAASDGEPLCQPDHRDDRHISHPRDARFDDR